MKRSEFKRQIENYVYFHASVPEKELSDFAEGLLELIEDAGMKPPKEKFCSVLLTRKHYWEPENEEA